MEFIQQLQNFTKGDILQGKLMIGIVVFLLLPLAFLLFKSNLSLQKGMAIPVGLLMIICIGYGSYVLYSKPIHLIQTEKEFQLKPKETLDSEWQKANADNKSYTTLKYIWGIGIIVFVLLYFILSKEYFKGISIGFAGLFFGFLLIDAFFHQRLNAYFEVLNKLTN